MAVFITRENNVIYCIRNLTTIAETGICKPKMKKDNLGYKHPTEKTGTKHIFSSVLIPCIEVLIERRFL